MTAPAASDADPDETVADEPETRISAYCSRPDRTVFTESGNPDGWIATDLTVELER